MPYLIAKFYIIMKQKILSPLLLGLILSAVNCFAGHLLISNPCENIAIEVEASYNYSYSAGKKYHSIGGNFKSRPLKGNKNIINFFDPYNVIDVAVKFESSKSKLWFVIDQKKFNVLQGGTHGDKIYKKDFIVDDLKGHIKYILNVVFSDNQEAGPIVSFLDVKILELSLENKQSKEL